MRAWGVDRVTDSQAHLIFRDFYLTERYKGVLGTSECKDPVTWHLRYESWRLGVRNARYPKHMAIMAWRDLTRTRLESCTSLQLTSLGYMVAWDMGSGWLGSYRH